MEEVSRVAVIVDVDGVVSPVHPPEAVWGDEVVVGNVFGPVLVSRALMDRLDALGSRSGVVCCWLTSWTSQMRAGMDPFPGPSWPVVAEIGDASQPGRGWWKLTALCRWLEDHPEVTAVAWCDDHLRGGRPAAVRRALTARGIGEVLLIRPATDRGLTPVDVERLERWVDRLSPPSGTGPRG